MRNRNNLKSYIIVFAACLLAIAMLFRQRMPFGKGNTSFAVKENTVITKVTFFEKGSKLTLLKDREDEWIIQGEGRAREEAVVSLLKILKEMKIKYPVASENFSRDIAAGGIEPVKVHVYGGKRVRKNFLVYRTGSNIYGNVMKIKPFSKPFVLYVPGYDAAIGDFFTANKLFWKPFVVFDYLPSEIEYVEVHHFNDTTASFRIIRTGKLFSLTASDGTPLTGWDTLKLKRYISYFTYIPFEKWANGLSRPQIDSIYTSIPMYRITAKKMNSRPVELLLWEKNLKKDDGSEITDPGRLWGKTGENEEILVMRYFDIDPVLKKLSYFMTK